MVHTYLVTVFKTMTLLLGGAITYFSFKAYSRTNAPALRALTIGFAIVTLGSLLAGVVDLYDPLHLHRLDALLVESALTTVGFGIILYSLYAE